MCACVQEAAMRTQMWGEHLAGDTSGEGGKFRGGKKLGSRCPQGRTRGQVLDGPTLTCVFT